MVLSSEGVILVCVVMMVFDGSFCIWFILMFGGVIFWWGLCSFILVGGVY